MKMWTKFLVEYRPTCNALQHTQLKVKFIHCYYAYKVARGQEIEGQNEREGILYPVEVHGSLRS